MNTSSGYSLSKGNPFKPCRWLKGVFNAPYGKHTDVTAYESMRFRRGVQYSVGEGCGV